MGQSPVPPRSDLCSLPLNRTSSWKHQSVFGFFLPAIVAFIVADDQRIQRILWRVAANHECLRFVDLVLEPSAGSLADLEQESLRFEPKFLYHGTNSAGVVSSVSDRPM